MKEKLTKMTQEVFGYGISILVVLCMFVALAYVVAFIIGAPGSVAINAFCTGKLLPVVYKAGIILCIIGIINMYLNGVLIFRLETNQDKKED
jgi:hypothetical protein